MKNAYAIIKFTHNKKYEIIQSQNLTENNNIYELFYLNVKYLTFVL